MLKIVFIIERTNCYRYFSPLINSFLKNKYICECWHFYSPQNANKNVYYKNKLYLFPDIKKSPFNKNSKIIFKKFKNNIDLDKLISSTPDVDYYFSMRIPIFFYKNTFKKKWCFIMEGFDSYFKLAR